MEFFQTFMSIGGVALCVMALVQLGLWSTQSLSLISQNKKQFELSRQLLRKQIDESAAATLQEQNADDRWSGFRSFRVSNLVNETDVCKSVYLEPVDGKPIASFQPGQHLTFKFQIPGETKPVIRCYSLSDRPGKSEYRISVKAMSSPPNQPDLPPGKASNYINRVLAIGDRIDVKAPSGHFVLDEASRDPVVLLAGGIGVTPLASMINHLTANNSDRLMLLIYAVRNSADHAFKTRFDELAAAHENLHIVNCYSHPLDEDVEGQDCQVKGFASADLLKKILPNNRCQYYMCGPPPFMEAMYGGLVEWGVPESRIFYEAFGPASIGKGKKQKSEDSPGADQNAAPAMVKFTNSDVAVEWTSDHDSLLELAEANDVSIDSGCRAGSCGTCATSLLKGRVVYPDPDAVDCEPGKCLVCIAKPDGPVELES